MKVQEIGLIWIVVKDLSKAIEYYTTVVGLHLLELHEEFGWAELGGETGTRLGIAQENPQEKMRAGENAVITFSVSDIEQRKREMAEQGAVFEGELIEIPGHVKMQTVLDRDGNRFQLCQLL